MTQLHKVGARITEIGRCAFVGILVGMLATQALAEGAPITSPRSLAKPETKSVPNESQMEQINLATTENFPLVSRERVTADVNALPDAPMESTGTSESSSLSSLTMPPDLKAMMDDAKQNSQSLQSAPATKPHGVQRPGMLVLGIAGIPLMGLGALFYSAAAGGNKNGGKAIVAGSIFFVPGALMSGFGFYLAFKPQR
jgi:hypothetical protein